MKVSIAVAWIIVGFVLGMLGFSEIGPLLGVPTMEGRAAMLGVFLGGPFGAMMGFSVGKLLADKYPGDQGKQWRVLGGTVAVVPVIAIGVVLFERVRAADRLDSAGNSYGLSFQVRLPAGTPSPADAKVAVRLISSRESPECKIYDAPHG